MTVGVSGETIRLAISSRLAVDFLDVMYMNDKRTVGFDFIFVLLWTGRDS